MTPPRRSRPSRRRGEPYLERLLWVGEQVRQDLLGPWVAARDHAEHAPRAIERVAIVMARTSIMVELLLSDPQIAMDGTYLQSLRVTADEARACIRATPALGPGGWARTCRVVVSLALVQDWVRWMRPGPQEWASHWVPVFPPTARHDLDGIGFRPEPLRREDGLPTPASLERLLDASGASCGSAGSGARPPRDPRDLKRLLCDPDRAWRLLAQRYMGATVATSIGT